MDFGYPWWLSYGHTAIFLPAALLAWAGWRRRWSTWLLAPLCALALWAGAAQAVVLLVIRPDVVPPMPTASFLATGEGRVLDIGAGTGRSTIMLLRDRPRARAVASDLFGDSFDHHFGHEGSPRERLMRNLRAAGVAGRATVATADMRQLPFAAGEFDGVVSAFAMDHLNREGSAQAVREAARVLKPGGEFLLMLVYNEPWARFSYGPMISHGGYRGGPWWYGQMKEAGFEVAESGTQPLTMWFLGRRK